MPAFAGLHLANLGTYSSTLSELTKITHSRLRPGKARTPGFRKRALDDVPGAGIHKNRPFLVSSSDILRIKFATDCACRRNDFDSDDDCNAGSSHDEEENEDGG